MFNMKNTADRIDNDSFVTNNGEIEMLSTSSSLNNRIKTLAVAIAITATALISAALPASADAAGPVPGFTPDGVNFITAAGFDGPDAQSLSYLNDGNHSPDGISNLQDAGQTAPVIAMWTPDGVNQVENVDGPAIVRTVVLAYLNGGNFSPDGIGNLQDAGQKAPVIAMWTPDGINQIENPDGPAVIRTVVLAYLNDGNFSPDGISNLHDAGVRVADIDALAFLYAETTDAAYVG